MSTLTSEINSFSQFCYNLSLAHKNSKTFCFIARARTLKAFVVNFLSAYLFQECQDICSSAINEFKIDLL